MIDDLKRALELTLHRVDQQLSTFQSTGYSFEEWFTWEVYYTLARDNNRLSVKPRYPKGVNTAKRFGDLLITSKHKTYSIFIELKLIHDYTQNKWRNEINRDYKALQAISHMPNYKPVQLILMVSAHKHLEQAPSWSTWLKQLSIWEQERDLEVRHPLPDGGQAVILGWRISQPPKRHLMP